MSRSFECQRNQPFSLKLAIKNADRGCDAVRAVELVRKNVHATWQLEKDQKQIEEEKVKTKNSFDRKERELLLNSQQTKKTSGRLINDVDFITVGLPQVILSPSTTKRSRLPWQEKSPREKTKGSTVKLRAMSSGQQEKDSTKVSSVQQGKQATAQKVSSLPRLQKAIEDSKKELNDAVICCKKVPQKKRIVKRMNAYEEQCEVLERSKSHDESTSQGDFLKVPRQKGSRIPETMFEDWSSSEYHSNSWPELEPQENTYFPDLNENRKDSHKRSRSFTIQ